MDHVETPRCPLCDGPWLCRTKVHDLILDSREFPKVARAGKQIELTITEFRLLGFLMGHPGRPLTRTDIVQGVWKQKYDGLTNNVDVYVCSLRRKLDRGYEH